MNWVMVPAFVVMYVIGGRALTVFCCDGPATARDFPGWYPKPFKTFTPQQWVGAWILWPILLGPVVVVWALQLVWWAIFGAGAAIWAVLAAIPRPKFKRKEKKKVDWDALERLMDDVKDQLDNLGEESK